MGSPVFSFPGQYILWTIRVPNLIILFDNYTLKPLNAVLPGSQAVPCNKCVLVLYNLDYSIFLKILRCYNGNFQLPGK